METGPRFIVSSDRLVKPGIEPATLVYKVSDITTASWRLLFCLCEGMLDPPSFSNACFTSDQKLTDLILGHLN